MKNIWIINHYATPPSLGGLTRHYYFAKYLAQKGYNVKIFASSAIHNSDKNFIDKKEKCLYKETVIDGVTYVHIKTCQYKSKPKRVLNLLQFYFRTIKSAKKIEKPDVIYASSPQLFGLISALKISKKNNNIPCVMEIRDLWPESMVSYGIIGKNNPITRVLYKLEEYVYVRANKIIFTMEGGSEYLKSRKYSNKIDYSRVFNLNNGIDLDKYNNDFKKYKLKDKDLDDSKTFKIVYTGSIRFIYNIKQLVLVAEKLKKEKDIKFLIYGEGPYKNELIKYCEDNKINNIIFKGFVDVKYIPYVLSKCDLCLLHGCDSDVIKYGTSTNKSFMYFASGKPILSKYSDKYNLISKYNCGITLADTSDDNYAKTIKKIKELDKKTYNSYCENSKQLSTEFDYRMLTDKLIDILEKE